MTRINPSRLLAPMTLALLACVALLQPLVWLCEAIAGALGWIGWDDT